MRVSVAALVALAFALSWPTSGVALPFVAEELFDKLKDEQAGVQSLQQQLAQMRTSLSSSEQVFANGTNETAFRQEDLRTITRQSFDNRGNLLKVQKVITTKFVELQATEHQLTLLSTQAKDNENNAKEIAEFSKSINSMGEVKNEGGGCLDALEKEKQGSVVQMWECVKKKESQMWSLSQSGRLKNMHGICVAAPKPSEAGSSVVMWGCDSTDPSQKWSYDNETGSLKTSGDLCLNAPDPTTKGSALLLVACADAAGQKWDMSVGDTGLRMRLDDLNAEMWNLQNPVGNYSMDQMEKELGELEKGSSGFLQQVGQKSRVVLANRLRHRANKLREAVNQIGDAASASDGGDNEMMMAPDGDGEPEALGADLGLAAAAAAAAF